MPYIVTVCKTCDCLTDAPGHGPEDEYCEAPDGFERIELFTEREIATRSPQDEDHEAGIEAMKAELHAVMRDYGPNLGRLNPKEGDDASRPGQR